MCTTNRSFTGQTEGTVAGSTGLYDFQFRQQSSAQGRWLVPDPAGLAAVNLTNPQTWNRYAYVANNPNSNVDALGLQGHCAGRNQDGDCDPVIRIGGTDLFGGIGQLSVLTAAWTYMPGGGSNPENGAGFNNIGMLSLLGSGSSGVGGLNWNLSSFRFSSASAPNTLNKPPYSQTLPCISNASQVMGAVEGNFPQFGNYSRWGGLESVTFSPPAGMGPGSTIPISVSVFGISQNLSVNVQSMNSQSMTFTTNPGHLIYPGSITFAASPASSGSINFKISIQGTIAKPAEFYFGGSNFEDAQWNHFLGQVGSFCKAGG
jgi:RHS repeat-associated protein